MKKIAIGTSDYKDIIESDFYYVDKTLFIKEVIESGKEVNIFTRPRRFGKTLNCSMLYYFLSNRESCYKLFKDKNILNIDSKKYKRYLNGYPVIYLSFKGIKDFKDYDGFYLKLKNEIKELLLKYTFLLDSKVLDSFEKEMFLKYYNLEKDVDITKSLKILSMFLRKHYKQKVYIIIDEYDAPIIHAYINNLYDDVMTLMKSLLGNTFKDNIYLEKGILTGVFKITGESVFSDMNNYESYDLTKDKYSNYFGFTHEEVKTILKEYNIEEKYNDVKKWYNGYLFGKQEIFNPLSILKYVDNSNHELLNYWVNVGGTDILKHEVFKLNDKEMIEDYHNLLLNGKIEDVKIDLKINLSRSLTKDDIWTLFMLTGYLKPKKYIGENKKESLVIPNKEVKDCLENIIKEWFDEIFISPVGNMYSAILNGNLKSFEEIFTSSALSIFSYHDVNKKSSEAFYHAFSLGLFIGLKDKYNIKSNRESGIGRYDVALIPKDKDKYPLYIFEYKKVYKSEDIDKILNMGYKQIDEKKYDIEFQKYDVKKIAIAFKGKEVKMKYS